MDGHDPDVQSALEVMTRVVTAPPDARESWRLDQLKEALSTAQAGWRNGNQSVLELIAHKLANAGRSKAWRLPIGESGILAFYLENVLPAKGNSTALKKEFLRMAGNACAECDENKARVLESGQLTTSLKGMLDEEDELLPFVISDIFNIVVDYEEAQLKVCEAGLSKKLAEIVSSTRLEHCKPSLGIIVQIFEMLIHHDLESKVASLSTPSALLTLATFHTHILDLDEFTTLCTVALAYLTYERFQAYFLSHNGFPPLQAALNASYTHPDLPTADSDTLDQLTQVRNAAVSIFADLSALPDFSVIHPHSSPVTDTLISWLASPPTHHHLQTAACLSLGNLARNDDTARYLLPIVFPPLITILCRALEPPTPANHETRPSAPLIHATLSFIKNLAIPLTNKAPIAEALFSSPSYILPRLWISTTVHPQVQFQSVSLTRMILVTNPTAASLLCTPLSLLPAGELAGLAEYKTRDGPGLSILHIYMDVALRADPDPTKLEAARGLAAVVKVLHAPSAGNEGEGVLKPEWTWGADGTAGEGARARLYASHAEAIVKTLTGMVTHVKHAVLRSEGIFVLALMGRTDEGVKIAGRVLEESAEACKVVVKAATGEEVEVGEKRVEEVVEEREKNEPDVGVMTAMAEGLSLEPQQGDGKQPEEKVRVDRENAVVLAAEVLHSCADKLSPARKALLERAIAEGGELINEDRKHR